MTPEEIAAQKAAEEAARKAQEDEIDPEVEAISKDPKAVKALLEAKRAANAEAKKLRLAAEESEKAEKAKADAALAEQGKFKELLEQEKGKGAKLAETFQTRLIDLHLKSEAAAAGALDDDAIIALASRAGIKVGEDFTVEGAKDAVEALKKAKPQLFGKKTEPVPPPRSSAPAPRAKFTLPAGDSTSAHEDLSTGFRGK